ncbi:17354_t:CDS:2, partial [Acaulospora colombiana]
MSHLTEFVQGPDSGHLGKGIQEGATALTGGIEAWQGYYQSARPTKGKIMINVDLSATTFYESGPLIMLVTKLLSRRTPDDLRRGIAGKERVKIERSLKNLKIKVTHRGESVSRRRFKVSKVTETPAYRTIFDMGDGSTTNVADYFERTYGKRLSYPNLPCVVVSRNNYLPLEVCEVIKEQRYIRKLDEKQTADMIRFTCQSPHIRANKIRQGVEILNYRGNEYLQQFGVTVSNDMAVSIPNKTPPIMYSNPQGDVEASLKKAWLRAGNAAKAQPQLILCILPNTGVLLYAEIKRVTDTIIGVPSQCIQGRHMMQAKKQYCANVCLKLNIKLGGMNVYINPAQIPFVSDRPTILMGADISHPSPGNSASPSISAVCASLDAKASRYSTTIRIQTGHAEIIADLASMVKELLKNFYQTCGRKPERILFYRDGVSEGQFVHVMNEEIKAVR